MAQDAEPNTDSSWQQRAVDRSLGTARARAVSRSGQILAAARDLTEETGGLDFTVQDIVDRSGLSLRSFYKHFGGKDELLIALLEELLRGFAEDLRREVDRYDDPVDRLRAYVTSFHRRASTSSAHGGRAFSNYHVRMLEVRNEEFASALEPQMKVLQEIVEAGLAAGRLRSDLGARDLTALLTVTLLSVAQMSLLNTALTEVPLDADRLWAWCAGAVGADVVSTAPAKRAAKSKAKPTPTRRSVARAPAEPRKKVESKVKAPAATAPARGRRPAS